MPTKDITKIANDYNEAYKKITGRVVICGGTGCIAGGSLKVYEAFQKEMENRKNRNGNFCQVCYNRSGKS